MHIHPWQRLASFTSFCSKVTNVANLANHLEVFKPRTKKKKRHSLQKPKGVSKPTSLSLNLARSPNTENEPTKSKNLFKQKLPRRFPALLPLQTNPPYSFPTYHHWTALLGRPNLNPTGSNPGGGRNDTTWKRVEKHGRVFCHGFFGAWWNCAWRCRFHNYFEIGFSKTFIQKRKVFHVYVHGKSFFFRILIPKKNCVQLFDTDPNWTSFRSSVFGHQKKICQKIWKLLWTMMLVEMAINFPSCTNNSNLHPLALENKSWSVPSAKSGWVDGNPSRAITGMLEKGQATIFTETWSCVILDHLGVSTTKTWQNFGGFDVSKRFKTKVSILFCLSPITVNIQKLPDMDTVVSSNPDHWVWIYTYMFFPSWYSFL